MAKHFAIIILGILLVAAIIWVFLFYPESEVGNTSDVNNITQEDKSNLIKVVSPKPGESIKSPAVISGEARGYWYFEASFPVRLFDTNGKELGVAVAQAQNEWMTENFVPFKTEMQFLTPETDTGIMVFEKDNPSGLPENADELRVPVRFR